MDDIDQNVRDALKVFYTVSLEIQAETKALKGRRAAAESAFETQCLVISAAYVEQGLSANEAHTRVSAVIERTQLADIGMSELADG